MLGQTFLRVMPIFTSLIFVSVTSMAVPSTSIFANMDLVTENIAQEFYRAWRLRLSELPENYQQVASGESVKFLSPKKEGCTKPSPSSEPLQVASISHASRVTAAGTLEEVTAYAGCTGRLLVSELLRVKGTAVAPTPLEDVLNGTRRFLRSANESERISIVTDPVRGPVITVVSREISGGQVTQVLILQKPLVTVRTTEISPGTVLSEIVLEDFNLHFSSGGSAVTSRLSGLKTKISILNKSGVLYFRIGNEPNYTNQRRIEKAYSESVIFAVDVTAVPILDVYLSQLPTTAIPKPAVGANQRILSELNLALTRLTSKTEIEQVRILIQQYLADIQNGDIIIDDRRPK